MSDDYDVFGTLNDLCTRNTYDELKEQLPLEETRNYDDDDVELDVEAIKSFTQLKSAKVKPKATKKKETAPVIEKSSKAEEEWALHKTTKKGKAGKKDKNTTVTIDCNTEDSLSETLNSRPRTRSATNANGGNSNANANANAAQTAAEALLQSFMMNEASLVNIANNILSGATGRGRGRGRGRKRNTTTTAWDDTTHMPPLFAGTALAAPTRTRKTTKKSTNTRSARQTYVSEVAARSANVDYVDLVTSPMPRINGVINVDSDTDEQDSFSQPQNDTIGSLDDSYVEDNPELSIKVVWKGFPEVFKMRKYQKFAHLYSKLAERENTATENIIFNIDDRIITPDDTPQSIDYKIYQFISGRVWEQKGVDTSLTCQKQKKKRDANCIRLKIQSDRWKKPLQVEMLKTEKCKILYIKCAEELSMSHNCFQLSFDGELLEHDATPLDLELEGGELIDLRFKK